jgi:mRNA interferase RelE/StbE
MYSIRFTKTAVKSLKKIPEKIQENILYEIEQLAISPAENQNVKKLINSSHYRLRVGSYRILFDKENELKIIDIIDILHRKNAYRRK